jgi:ribosomal protein S18 acetylase RimI-like enzyme
MLITIRRAIHADAEALSEISRQTFYDTFTGTCTDEDMASFLEEYFNLKQVQLELSNVNDLYYLAESDGKVIGYLRLMEDYTNFDEMLKWRALELKRIYVSKEFHGLGIAQQLMDFTIQYATENNYEVVWLGVWEHNLRAQKFYEKYGFINSGHTHDFPIGNTPQTDFWLWKFL